MSRETYILRPTEIIERELPDLKTFISAGNAGPRGLRALWKGVDIPDEEIEEANDGPC